MVVAATDEGPVRGACDGGAAMAPMKGGIVISDLAKTGGLVAPGVITRVPSVSTLRVRPDSGSMYAAEMLTSDALMSGAIHELVPDLLHTQGTSGSMWYTYMH